jgi:hypothetical protein
MIGVIFRAERLSMIALPNEIRGRAADATDLQTRPGPTGRERKAKPTRLIEAVSAGFLWLSSNCSDR